MLGTGNATVTNCYNTCFTLSENEQYFLVDAGGGNQILKILEEENIPLTAIHDMFVSHAHTDHVLGVIWIIRMIGQRMNGGTYEGNFNVYCHREIQEVIIGICRMTLVEKITRLFGGRIRFISLEDGEQHTILNSNIRFFDIGSTKMRQFGFIMEGKDGTRLVCCGDEPLQEKFFSMAAECDWLMHEAFCLHEEREIFRPYEKHHSTVKDACELAERLKVKNLILYHTEDKHIGHRKALYLGEGQMYYQGNLYVPDDRETLRIWN